jgi:Rrf2 family protein
MASALHMTDAASMGLHAMVLLAEHPQEVVPTHRIATTLGVSKDHLAKVLQRLVRCDLLLGLRGPKGGFNLCKDPDQITLLDILQAIEGPLPENTCMLNSIKCVRGSCIFGNLLCSINHQVSSYFDSTTLAQLIVRDARQVPGV